MQGHRAKKNENGMLKHIVNPKNSKKEGTEEQKPYQINRKQTEKRNLNQPYQ